LRKPDRTRRREMLAIDCPCGHRLEAEDAEGLFRKAREHVDRDHPEMEKTDEELRRRVAADAYEVETAG
jgi:2-methylcitrate dehydratase PrpD